MTVLVAATREPRCAWKTAGVVAGTLALHGVATDLMPLEMPPDPAGEGMPAPWDPADYEAVVVGSGAADGRWPEPARRFVAEHAHSLADRPVWLFTSIPSPSGAPGPAEVGAAVHPLDHHVFAGLFRLAGLGLAERTIVEDLAYEADRQDRAEVRAWALGIAGQVRHRRALTAPPVLEGQR